MIKDIPVFERPMEKLMNNGVRSLSDSELLANIIRSGTREISSLEVCERLLKECGTLHDINCLTVPELVQYKGVGKTKACQILSAFELGRRVGKPLPISGKRITSPPDLVDFFSYHLADEEVENFVIINLNVKNIVLSWNIVTVGILNASLVHPREVFKTAIRECACSIIAIHNHPSGSVEPSEEDYLVTRRLSRTGDLVGIKLLDHLVIAGNSYYSFKESGILKN